MSARKFMEQLERIPHILDMARQQDELRRYDIQEALAKEYRQEGRPFLYSMPMRHLYTCPLCGQQRTEVAHRLENPSLGRQYEFRDLVLHQAQEHGIAPETDLVNFLSECLEGQA